MSNKNNTLSNYVDNYKNSIRQEQLIREQLKQKKIFKLDESSIKSLLDNQIKPLYPNIRYEIYKAKYTNSYYIKFWHEKSYVTARISDHESYTGAIGSMVNSKTTKEQIVNLFKERIKALKRKNEAYLFKKIKEDRTR